MIESDVWISLIATLRQGLNDQGLSAVKIKQSYQPVSQGVDSQDTVYLFKLTSKRYGFQGKTSIFNAGNNNFDIVETYKIEATFQLTALVERDIKNAGSITSYDVADTCAAILQASKARQSLLVDGIGILRITEIRTPYSVNDRDQFDQDSNFDFILTYNQQIASTVPIAEPIDADIQRV